MARPSTTPHEKTQILVGSGELAGGDPPGPLEKARCPWLPVMEAREPGQTAGKRKALLVFVCLGTEEDKPTGLRLRRRLGGPVVRAWSQTAWVQVKSNLLAVFWLYHVGCMIKEVMTLPLNLCPSHHPEHTWKSAQYTVGGQEGLCSKPSIILQLGPALSSMAAPAPAGRV